MNLEVDEVGNGFTVHMNYALTTRNLIYKTNEVDEMIADVVAFLKEKDFPEERITVE